GRRTSPLSRTSGGGKGPPILARQHLYRGKRGLAGAATGRMQSLRRLLQDPHEVPVSDREAEQRVPVRNLRPTLQSVSHLSSGAEGSRGDRRRHVQLYI